MNEQLNLKLRGHIKQRCLTSGKTILEQDNLVVDCSFEIMLWALFNQQRLAGIAFGFTGGKPVTKDLRTLSNLITIAPLDSTPDSKSFISKDQRGLRTIGTCTGVVTPEGSLTYDTLGLITNTNLLFAAATFPSRTITLPVATDWTIYLRG